MIGRIWSALIVTGCLAALQVIGVPSAAIGQPPGDAPPPDITFSGQQLGMSQQLSFRGHDATQKVSIPVPEGLSPTTFSGMLESASNIPSGYLEAQTVDGRSLGSVPVPNFSAERPAAPFSFDIRSVPVVGHQAQLNLALRVSGTEAVCSPPPTLTVGNFSTAFTGNARPPTTIEEFLPAIAPVFDIYVDPQPTDAEKLTALSLVAAVTKYYQPAPVKIDLRPLPRATPVPPPDRDVSTRAILIRDVDEPNPGVRLVTDAGPPFLAMSGQGDALTRQARLFRDGLQKVAQAGEVSVESADPPVVDKTSRSTFGQLGITGRTSVLGESYIYLNLAPAMATAGKPSVLDIRLLANYTPVSEDQKGTMIVAMGDIVLATVRLDASGRVDSRIAIPADLSARDQDVTLTIRYEPDPRACSPLTLPMNFELDPMSTTSLRPGGPVAMGGFASLPQAFVPKFKVAFDNSDPDELVHAATIIGLIQRLSPTALTPELVSLDDAAASDTSALIIASGQSVHEHALDPPIDPTGDKSKIDLPSSAVVDVASGLAALQSYAQNNRTVVLLTASGPWTLATPLFDYLARLNQGWRDLSGDVLVVGQGGNPQDITVRSDGPVMVGASQRAGASSSGAEQPEDTRLPWYEWILIGAGALIVLAGAIYLVSRRFREANRAPR
ncbi:cellulose biosynthesis cyclic di-GMP-binding regulatory protein BcsB [Mycobacterium sp. E740]|uniref:cellulose biosynthesis cyclic di-GMP-binding regulatory protein BcsB n=1 Tax=Mycobacterium sp. E740 TaxID=1834149 RepID=UPI000800FBCE|nr:cellulose biosynthesis cyclic di-GMP-binding regulatory protein BcsB [Mycobacterium sp. E740]OBI72378.1 hypothetical protein A5663_08085 [Mycobacterium sp. E740]